MLNVDLDNILTEEDALTRIREVFDRVETAKETYVVTKGGRPVFAIVEISRLEQDQGLLNAPMPAQAPQAQQPPVEAVPAVILPGPAPVPAELPPMPGLEGPAPAPLQSVPLPAADAPSAPPAAATPAPEAPLPAAPAPAGLPPLGGTPPGLPDMPATDLSSDSPLA